MLQEFSNKLLRIIVVLEGGYNLLNVASGCAAIARVLQQSLFAVGERSVCENGALHVGTESAIRETCQQHCRSWPVLAGYERGSVSGVMHQNEETRTL